MKEAEQIHLLPGEYTRTTRDSMTAYVLENMDYKGCRTVWTITTGRTGTEWLTNFLNQWEPLRACHEPFPGLFSANRRTAEGRPSDPEVVHEARAHLVRGCYERGQVYIDLSPFMAHLVPQIREVFAWSRFLHLVRDPRAFVCSAAPRHWYRYPHPQDHWWPRNHPEGLDNIQRLCWWWNEVHSRGLALEKELGPDAVHRLRAEDMWSDVEAVRGLMRWLKMPTTSCDRADGIIMAAQESPKNVSPLARVEWDPAWEPYLLEVAGETMRELGYA